MSESGIQPPARQLDEFEELVFEYTSRMGLGNDEVGLPKPAAEESQNYRQLTSNFSAALGCRRPQLQSPL